MNWGETVLSQGMRWSSGWDGRAFEVMRLHTPGKGWCVTLRKGPSKKGLRRVRKLCFDSLTKSKAEQESRRILQAFVLGKLK